MSYGCDTSSFGCCGVLEIHYFADDHDDASDDADTRYSEYKEESFQELLNNIIQNHKSYVLHIHFKKSKKFDGTWADTYEWEGMRQLVAQIPGVFEIPEHINPNSGNKIVGYVWLNQ